MYDYSGSVWTETISVQVANPILKIWGIETDQDDIFIINELIDQKVEKLIEAMKIVAQYQNREIKMSDDELKSYLRKPITQEMIDLGLL